MSYTDQDVERVAEAIFNETGAYPVWGDTAWDDLPDTWDSSYGPGKDHYRSIARAALEAIEREPLEDVVHDLHPGTKICHVWPLLEGGYEAEIGVPVRQDRDGWWDHERSRGEGATIDEAIRNAVVAAKGGE